MLFFLVSKYGVISGPYFPVFSPKTGKYELEITPYLDTFHAVLAKVSMNWMHQFCNAATDAQQNNIPKEVTN